MTETYTTPNKHFVVPDINSKHWGDEIQHIVEDIDAYLAGVSQTTITKNAATIESLSIGSSINVQDGGKITFGTDNDLVITFNPTQNTSTISDTASGDTYFTFPHGSSSGPITSDRNIVMKDGAVATQAYVDSHDSIDGEAIAPDSIETHELNTVRWAADGPDIQRQIDILNSRHSRGVVALHPSHTYEITEEIVLPRGTVLNCNNGHIQIMADVNGIYCGPYTKINNLNIRAIPDTYSSDIIVLDSGRARTGYGAGGTNTTVDVNGRIHGSRSQATGLHCIADDGYGIGLGNTFRLTIQQCHQAIHMDGIGSFINTSPVYCDIIQCERGIKANGGGGYVEYYGTLQPIKNYSTNAIDNDAHGGLTFRGIIWDAHRFDGSEPILQGSDIMIYSPFCNIFSQQGFNSDGAPRQIIFDQNATNPEFMTMQDITNQEWYAFEFNDGTFEFSQHNGERFVQYAPNGNIRHPDAQFFLPFKDIQTVSPRAVGETCIATANSSPNNEWSLCFSGDGSTWTVLDGQVINPS